MNKIYIRFAELLIEGLSGASKAYLKTRKDLRQTLQGTLEKQGNVTKFNPPSKDKDKIIKLVKHAAKLRDVVPQKTTRKKYRETDKYKNMMRRRRQEQNRRRRFE